MKSKYLLTVLAAAFTLNASAVFADANEGEETKAIVSQADESGEGETPKN